MKFLTSKAITEINSSLDKREIFPSFSENRVDLEDLNEYSGVRIIFSEEAYIKLLQLLGKQKSIGSYFYGKISNNLVFISTSLSDYDIQRRKYCNPVISANKDNLDELKLMTEESDAIKRPFNAVVDFRVYDDFSSDENGVIYMDSDLYSYAYQQLYLQPVSKNSVIYFGIISVKENGSYKLRCVFYDSLEHTFIKVNNIYYLRDKEIHKFNNDSVSKSVELTVAERQDILRKLKAYNDSSK